MQGNYCQSSATRGDKGRRRANCQDWLHLWWVAENTHTSTVKTWKGWEDKKDVKKQIIEKKTALDRQQQTKDDLGFLVNEKLVICNSLLSNDGSNVLKQLIAMIFHLINEYHFMLLLICKILSTLCSKVYPFSSTSPVLFTCLLVVYLSTAVLYLYEDW